MIMGAAEMTQKEEHILFLLRTTTWCLKTAQVYSYRDSNTYKYVWDVIMKPLSYINGV